MENQEYKAAFAESAETLKKEVAGKVDADTLSAMTTQIKDMVEAESYGADLNIASMVFYFRLQVNVHDGKSFNGSGGGGGLPGGGVTFGKVFVANGYTLADVYESSGFWCNSAAAYVNVFFFKGKTIVGSFHGGGLSTVLLGSFGGNGKWK